MQAIHAPDLFAHQTSRRLTSSRFQRGGKPSVLVTLKVWPSCREWSHGLRCSELQARCTALQSCLRAFSSKASKGPRSCQEVSAAHEGQVALRRAVDTWADCTQRKLPSLPRPLWGQNRGWQTSSGPVEMSTPHREPTIPSYVTYPTAAQSLHGRALYTAIKPRVVSRGTDFPHSEV